MRDPNPADRSTGLQAPLPNRLADRPTAPFVYGTLQFEAVLGPVWSCDLMGLRPGRVGVLGVERWGVSTSTFGCRVGVRLPVSAGR